MKKAIAALSVVVLFLAYPAYAAITQSPSFNGSSQYFTASDSTSLSVTGNLTLEGWFYITTAPTTNQEMFLMGKTDANTQRSYALRYFNNSGTLTLSLAISSNGSGQTSVAVNENLGLSTWHHIAVVYTAAGGTADFYVDGTQVGTQQSGLPTSIFDSTAQFGIGNSDTAQYPYLAGRASLLRVWSTTRTGTQINNNKCTVLGATSNLSAEWTLDNVLTDDSGNGNTLTNNGSITFAANVPNCATTATTFISAWDF